MHGRRGSGLQERLLDLPRAPGREGARGRFRCHPTGTGRSVMNYEWQRTPEQNDGAGTQEGAVIFPYFSWEVDAETKTHSLAN